MQRTVGLLDVERLEDRTLPSYLGAPPTFPAGTHPRGVAVGDFNGDGKVDLVVTNEDQNQVSVLPGKGDGTLGAPVAYAAGTTPRAVVVADFNGDGKLDLAVADSDNSSSGVSILLGNGNGTFQTARFFATGNEPYALAVGDFNGDGKLDVVTANELDSSAQVSVLLGKGDGTFQSAVNYPGNAFQQAIVVGDFNGDGKADIATGDTFNGKVSVLLNKGNGTFATPVNYTAGGVTTLACQDLNGDHKLDLVTGRQVLPGNGDGTFGTATAYGAAANAIVTSDFNGDGKPDLAATFAGGVSVFPGKGDGTFLPAVNYVLGTTPLGVATGDFNGDGKPDLVTANYSTNSVSILLDNGDGTFPANVSYPAGGSPSSLVEGDFNGDGRPDLATADRFSGTGVWVLLNNGDGTYKPPVYYATGDRPTALIVADFNGDGKPDLATANYDDNNVSVLLGNGDGTFGAAINTPVGHGPSGLAAADFNGDGKLDLVLLNFGDGDEEVLFGKGDGTFPTSVAFTTNEAREPTSIAVGDFNGDGHPDFAVNNPSLQVFLNDGDGHSFHYYTYNLSVDVITVGDFDGDGKLDLAAVSNQGSNFSILFGNGDGTFQVQSPIPLPAPPTNITPAYLNDDKLEDLVLTFGNGTVGVMLGTGSGNFSQPVFDPVCPGPAAVLVGDFNGDCADDLAVADGCGVTVLLNQDPAPVTTLKITGPSNVVAGEPFSVTVCAYNECGELARDYQGTVGFSSSDGMPTLPHDYTFKPSDQGCHTFTVTLCSPGLQNLTVVDKANPTLADTAILAVDPGPFSILGVKDFTLDSIEAGVAFSFKIAAEDVCGNELANTTVKVKVTITDTQGQPPPPVQYQGDHTFNLTLFTAGAQTITFTDQGTGITGSFPIQVDAAQTRKLKVTDFPSPTTAGTPGTFTVTAIDAYGNITPDYRGRVRFTSTDGGASLPPDYTFTAGDAGVRTGFPATLFRAGSQDLTATDVADASITGSESVTVDVAAPDHLGFRVQPGNAFVGHPISPAIQVQVLDPFGNLEAGDNSDQVALSLGGNSGGAVLSGTTTATVSGGIATFADLSLDQPGNAYTLSAASAGLPSVASQPFSVTFPPPDHLAFLVQPAGTTAGSTLDPAVQVEVLDQFGQLVSSDNGDQVTLSIAGGPGGFLAGSTTTVTVRNGVATFSNLALTVAGTYSLSERGSGGLSGPDSDNLTIDPGAPDQLAFGAQPGSATAGQVINPSVTVRVLDAYGNLVSGDDTDQVQLSVASGPGDFTPASTTTGTVQGGVASFSNLVLDSAGAYSLSATASGTLTGPDSASFTVHPGKADHLAFAVQPSDSTAGSSLSPAPQVQVLDPFGNLLTSDNTDRVTLSVASGPGGFSSGSTTTLTVQGGVATFSNLVLRLAGVYSLGVSGGGLSGSASAAFTIQPGQADHLAFVALPAGGTAGAVLSPAVKVQVQDRFGNLVASDSSDQVTLGVASGPGGFDGSSTLTATVSGGVARFSNLVLDGAGTYTLSASSGSLSSPSSSSFSVGAAAADHLAFAVQPGDAVAGAPISPAVQVAVLDRFDNLLRGDSTDQVTVSVATGPGTFATTSTTTATVSAGIAGFSNLVFTQPGSWTLGVTAGALSGPGSNSFTVHAAAADHLAFVVPPGDGVAGQPLGPAARVEVLDRFGNLLADDDTDVITLSVASGPGAFSAASTPTVTAQGGIASFGNLVLDRAGDYTLSASGPGGLTTAASGSFHVSPAAADHLAFLSQPGRVAAGQVLAPALEVAVVDAFGNRLGSDTSTVTVSLAGSPPNATLGGTRGVAAVAGVATFSDLSISGGGRYSLQASDGSLGPATSAAFEVDQVLLSSATVRAFRPTGTVVGGLAVVGSTNAFHYSLVNGSTVTDNSSFTIRGNQLLSADAFDPTLKARFRILVQASDQTGFSLEQALTVTVLDDPRLKRRGHTLSVAGTKGNDRFSFTPGPVWDGFSLDGTSLAVNRTGVDRIVFQGGGGSDSATLSAGSGASTLSLSATGGTLSGQGFGVTLVAVGHVTISGGPGGVARLTGSKGNDTFVGTPSSATLSGSGYLDRVTGFGRVTVLGTGGSDTAHLFGGPGSASFTGSGKTGTLSGPAYRILVSGLNQVWLSGSAGGHNKLHRGALAYVLHVSGTWLDD